MVHSEKVVSSFANFDDPTLAVELESFQSNYEKVSDQRNLLKITEINGKFHNRLAESTGNQFIVANSADLHNLARRLSYFVYRMESKNSVKLNKHLKRINKDHRTIIQLIKMRDRQQLVSHCTEHALLFKKQLRKVVGRDDFFELDFLNLN